MRGCGKLMRPRIILRMSYSGVSNLFYFESLLSAIQGASARIVEAGPKY